MPSDDDYLLFLHSETNRDQLNIKLVLTKILWINLSCNKLLLLLFQRFKPAPNYNFPVGDLCIVLGKAPSWARRHLADLPPGPGKDSVQKKHCYKVQSTKCQPRPPRLILFWRPLPVVNFWRIVAKSHSFNLYRWGLTTNFWENTTSPYLEVNQ